MSLRFVKGYWTIYQDNQGIASFASFEAAWKTIWETSVMLSHE